MESGVSVPAVKVPRQCPFLCQVKIRWKRGKDFGSDEGKALDRSLVELMQVWEGKLSFPIQRLQTLHNF